MPYRWQTTEFAQLGVDALYSVLHLRQAVFVVEQACLYQDLDGLDQPTNAACTPGPASGRVPSVESWSPLPIGTQAWVVNW